MLAQSGQGFKIPGDPRQLAFNFTLNHYMLWFLCSPHKFFVASFVANFVDKAQNKARDKDLNLLQKVTHLVFAHPSWRRTCL